MCPCHRPASATGRVIEQHASASTFAVSRRPMPPICQSSSRPRIPSSWTHPVRTRHPRRNQSYVQERALERTCHLQAHCRAPPPYSHGGELTPLLPHPRRRPGQIGNFLQRHPHYSPLTKRFSPRGDDDEWQVVKRIGRTDTAATVFRSESAT